MTLSSAAEVLVRARLAPPCAHERQHCHVVVAVADALARGAALEPVAELAEERPQRHRIVEGLPQLRDDLRQ